MARTFASIVTAIWKDREFCGLSAGAQRTYFMLISQPEISAAGVLPLTIARWKQTLPENEREHLPDWLNELGDHRFTVMDIGTEEVLVRSFVKWDRGYRNPKRQPVIREAMSLVISPKIAESLAQESERLGFDYGESLPQVNRLSDTQSGFDRYEVVDRVCSNRNPQSAIRNPRTVAEPIDDPESVRSQPVRIAAAKIARAYTDKVRLVDRARLNGVVTQAQFAGYPDTDIIAALDRLADAKRTVTPETLRHEIEGTTGHGRASPRKPSADTNAQAALNRAAAYQETEQRQIGAGP